MKRIAIIPARGGSKRIPHKNIKSFCGKPILQYSIEAALASGCFEKVLVSTDDEKIAQAAKALGATVPFLRSEKNADDFAPLAGVLVEVLENLKSKNEIYDYCSCILPTAPFLKPETLQESWKAISSKQGDALIAVTSFSYPIQRALRIKDDYLEMRQPENLLVRSQDLEPAYHDAGQFYWLRVETFLKEPTFFPKKTIPFLLPNKMVQDIDTPEDWEIAEFKFKELKK